MAYSRSAHPAGDAPAAVLEIGTCGFLLDHAPLPLAERILELLDQGRFTATYKYAVLLALLDPCLGAAAASDGSTPLAEALARAPARYRRLLDFVEWKLIEMPLPRLQTIGDESVTFLYAINWTRSVRQGADKAGLEETHRRCVACR